ncbi:hypothetical protein Pmani_020800 [Petrolisthes manimaculis]|uniref:Uncharacterized protein n=1 Tax=Petrolisthes manimaculis TaxID=1843537 RepID=A0AAE1PG07_9EUCA|nr:hypothetical protein Pmani_020800 [Petrolisthes manimaculis]
MRVRVIVRFRRWMVALASDNNAAESKHVKPHYHVNEHCSLAYTTNLFPGNTEPARERASYVHYTST